MLSALLIAHIFCSLPKVPPSLEELEATPERCRESISRLVARQMRLEKQKNLVWDGADAVLQLDACLHQAQMSLPEAEKECRQRLAEAAAYPHPLMERRISQAEKGCRSSFDEVEESLIACRNITNRVQAQIQQPALFPLEPALRPRFFQVRLSLEALQGASEQVSQRLSGRRQELIDQSQQRERVALAVPSGCHATGGPADVVLPTLSRIERRLQHAEQLLRNLHVPLLARREILSVEYGIARLGDLVEAERSAGHAQLAERFEGMLAPAVRRAERLTEEVDAACAERLDGEAKARVAFIERLAGEVRLDAVCDAMKEDLLDPSITAAQEEASLHFFAMCLGEDA